jgi:hypothetical protein
VGGAQPGPAQETDDTQVLGQSIDQCGGKPCGGESRMMSQAEVEGRVQQLLAEALNSPAGGVNEQTTSEPALEIG